MTVVSINALTRAEYKYPFILKFQIDIRDDPGQAEPHARFSLTTPDPRDGFILNSNLYGEEISVWEAFLIEGGGAHNYAWRITDKDGTHWSADNAWDHNIIYDVELDCQIVAGQLVVVTTITDPTLVVKFTHTTTPIGSRCGTLRFMVSACADESNVIYTEFYIDEVRVIRSRSNKTKAVVSILGAMALPGWFHRVKITIDHNDVGATLTDFPLLLYLSTVSGLGPDDVSFIFDELGSDANRKKIAVTLSDGVTQCYVEIEKWDDADETAWLWVKVPSISNTVDTVLYLYYDSTHPDNVAYVGDINSVVAESVWEASAKMIQHMRDDTTSTILDSTGNDNDGTKKAANEPIETALGKIDSAQDFVTDDYVQIGDVLDPALGDISFSCWIKTVAGSNRIIDKSDSVTTWRGLIIFVDITNVIRVIIGDGTTAVDFVGTTVVTDDLLHHIAVIFDRSGNAYIKVDNGAAEGTTDISALVASNINNAMSLTIGSIPGGGGSYFEGIIDELRFYDVVKSVDWETADYESERDHLVNWGSEEGKPIIMASEDVVAISVTNRKATIPAADVTLRNERLQYNGLTIIDEIEIRAGWEHMLWLLFRGNIDQPELAYPHSRAQISGKDFAKRLDFRETDSESWGPVTSKVIIEDLIATYFSGVFTADWIETGDTVSLNSNDESVNSVIRKLADMNGFLSYIDFNKCLHFVDPINDITDSNITIEQPYNILAIGNRHIDEILNKITVIGLANTYTAEDAPSQAAYWLRERTFTDDTLTDLPAVTARANELLAIYKDPAREVPIELGEYFVLNQSDRVTIICAQVDMATPGEDLVIESITYSYGSGGLKTSLSGYYRGVTMADILSTLTEI